jgi:hypothetical protein
VKGGRGRVSTESLRSATLPLHFTGPYLIWAEKMDCPRRQGKRVKGSGRRWREEEGRERGLWPQISGSAEQLNVYHSQLD